MYSADEFAMEMFIISKGDCRVKRRIHSKIIHKRLPLSKSSSVPTTIVTTTAVKKNTPVPVAVVSRGKGEEDEDGSLVDMGRVGPGGVLADYVATQTPPETDVLYKETVVTDSMLQAYVITRFNFFNKLKPIVYEKIITLLREVEAPLTDIWDNVPLALTAEDLRVKKAWDTYKKEIVTDITSHNVHPKSITDVYRKIDILEDDSRVEGASMSVVPTSSFVSLTDPSHYHHHNQHQHSYPTATAMTQDPPPSPSLGAIRKQKSVRNKVLGPRSSIAATSMSIFGAGNGIGCGAGGDMNRRHASVVGMQAVRRPTTSPSLSTSTSTSATTAPDTYTQRLPFALIQFHLEGSSKWHQTKYYFRLCGIFSNCGAAKKVAEAVAVHTSVTLGLPMDNSGGATNARNGSKPKAQPINIHWHSFESHAATMPLQLSDHFMVYCRNATIEIASFDTPRGTMFQSPYPAACKIPRQCFGCVAVSLPRKDDMSITSEQPLFPTPTPFLSSPQQTHTPHTMPALSRQSSTTQMNKKPMEKINFSPVPVELTCVKEMLVAAPTVSDCIRYGTFQLRRLREGKQTSPDKYRAVDQCDHDNDIDDNDILAVPMYTWLDISEEGLRTFSVSSASTGIGIGCSSSGSILQDKNNYKFSDDNISPLEYMENTEAYFNSNNNNITFNTGKNSMEGRAITPLVASLSTYHNVALTQSQSLNTPEMTELMESTVNTAKSERLHSLISEQAINLDVVKRASSTANSTAANRNRRNSRSDDKIYIFNQKNNFLFDDLAPEKRIGTLMKTTQDLGDILKQQNELCEHENIYSHLSDKIARARAVTDPLPPNQDPKFYPPEAQIVEKQLRLLSSGQVAFKRCATPIERKEEDIRTEKILQNRLTSKKVKLFEKLNKMSSTGSKTMAAVGTAHLTRRLASMCDRDRTTPSALEKTTTMTTLPTSPRKSVTAIGGAGAELGMKLGMLNDMLRHFLQSKVASKYTPYSKNRNVEITVIIDLLPIILGKIKLF
eukprot:gene3262-6453_t